MSPAIKLFGKTISFSPGNKVVSDITEPEEQQSNSATSVSSVDMKDLGIDAEMKHGDNYTSSTDDTIEEAETLSSGKGPLSPEQAPKNDEPSEGSVSPETTLKKPDKLLPCPRCNSMNTKFCYYNNYNVSQPRHFCKNCQRYWTAGGTMRNVPVGSGRRKNKNASIPNYHHIIVSDDFQATQANAINGIHFSSMNPNRFLIFGSGGYSDQSTTSTLNHVQRSQNRTPNDIYEHSSQSSSPTSNSAEKGGNEDNQESRLQTLKNTSSHTCFPQPVFGPSGIPVTFYPMTPYWGGPWGTPTSTLGKHSRDGTILEPSNLGKENLPGKILGPKSSVLVPKTLRIDDPNVAAKSSIWSTLGIKNEKRVSINGTSLFKAFEAKGDRSSSVDNASMVLQANPAALSRSLKFHESA